MNEIMQGAVNLIPSSWQYPEITCARITLENDDFKTDNFKETKWSQKTEIKIHGIKAGILEVFYIEEKPERDEGPFLKKERQVIDAFGQYLGHIIEHLQKEKKTRQHNEDSEKSFKKRTARIRDLEILRAQSQMTAATGRMAAIVAHEINNPLAGIKNSFMLVKKAVPSDHEYYEHVERIEKEIDRVADIVRHMYEIYHPYKETPRKFILSDTIKDVIALLESSCRKHGVTIHFDSQDDNSYANLPEELFRQVIYNILQNAIEASPPGETVNVNLKLSDIIIQITVQDHGDGIPDEVQTRIYEPFFTNKGEIKDGGLGLGLSICKGIVEKLNGSLDFKTEPNEGTIFRITLPLQWEMKEAEKEE